MSDGGVILSFHTLNASNVVKLDFDRPIDNKIRIVSPECLVTSTKYYGDMVNLRFWSLLGAGFGSTMTGSPITLTPGYRYIYNYTTKIFSIYDSMDSLVSSRSGITDLSLLNIDFSVMNSHQFEIFVDPNTVVDRYLFFPVTLVYEDMPSVIQEVVANGVHNYDISDSKRPYFLVDSDNPSINLYYIRGSILDFTIHPWFRNDFNMWGKYIGDKESGRTGMVDVSWLRNCPTNYFYLDGFFIQNHVKFFESFRTMMSVYDLELPKLSKNMYPDLMPMERDGEVINNRPLYEPWLIVWLKYLYNIHTGDPTPFEMLIFDLSPRWS